MKYSVIEDLSILTTVPTTNLNQLCKKAIYCICDDIDSSRLKGESLVDIDIGIGTLSILIGSDAVQYRFIPSNVLDSSVKRTIVDGKNPLVEKAEKLLAKKIISTYKDYFNG